MERFSPTLPTGNITDVLNQGFECGTTYFINWETITKKGNLALKDSERKNIKQHIADAHRNNKQFIVIIDEEHLNNTAKPMILLMPSMPIMKFAFLPHRHKIKRLSSMKLMKWM